MKKFFTENKILICAVLLGLTFFAFVDDRYRSFDDSNQYFVEAREFAQNRKPPVKAIAQDLNWLGMDGPSHTPPLTAYSWSWLNNKSDHRQTLWNVKFFQACLLFFSFLGFMWCLGNRKFSFDAFIISCLVFLNEFTRSLVFAPISEAASITFLIVSYMWPQLSGITSVFQIATRHPVAILHGAVLWRNKKNISVIIPGVITAIIFIAYFQTLLVPSKLTNMAPSLAKVVNTYSGLIKEWAYLYFNHLLPDETLWFQVLWGALVTTAFILLLHRKRKAWLVWSLVAFYCLIILIPFSAGMRYFFPIFIFLILEFKPSLPKWKWSRLVFVVMAMHLIIQQVGAISEFKRYPVPETDTPGLAETKKWLKDNQFAKSRIMMIGRRFCVHYFETECFGLVIKNDIFEALNTEKIDFVLITGLAWHGQEREFETLLKDQLAKSNFNFDKHLHNIQGVQLFDVREIKNKARPEISP